MNEMLAELIVAIITAVIGYIIGIFKDRQYNLKVEGIYSKYKLLFKVSGAMLRVKDEQLYHEVEEAIERMQTAYQDESFTTKDFNEIVLECKDVFDRAQVVLNRRG